MRDVVLLGAEQVQNAARTMSSAASEMLRAASSIDESLRRHERFLDEWLDRFAAALAPPARDDGWLPIESVPLDETEILIFCPSLADSCLVAFYAKNEKHPTHVWHTMDGPSYHKDVATHWRPLPSPPARGNGK
jgi:hypothetical protein